MPYQHKNKKGQMYTLYNRKVTLKNGTNQVIFFFARSKPKSGSMLDALPVGYAVGENIRTGLPYLRRSGRR